MMNSQRIYQLANEVATEVHEASEKHKAYNSVHEAYGVLMEEVEEFWEEVKKKSENRSKDNMRKELLQVAAVCLRTIHDLL